MNIENMLNQVREQRKLEAVEQHHLSIGSLINALQNVEDKTLPLLVDGDAYPGDDGHSYRGYYEDISFGLYTESVTTVEEFIEHLNDCIGETFEGWKGGDYRMNAGTLVWFSPEGMCSGLYPTHIEIFKNKVIIHTEEETF